MSALDVQVRALARRAQLGELYQAYAECLDSGALDAWPGFFTEDAVYRVTGRENHDRNLPLAAMFCEGRGMLEDRVLVISKVMVYAPRTIRHVTAPPRVVADAGDVIRSEAAFAVFHTLPHEPTALLSVGRYEDEVVTPEGAAWRFGKRVAVYDSLIVPNSLVYPL